MSLYRLSVRLHLKHSERSTAADSVLSLHNLEALETLNVGIRIIREWDVLDDSAWRFLAKTLESLPNHSSLRSLYLTPLVKIPVADEDEHVSKAAQSLTEQSQLYEWDDLIRILRQFSCLSLVQLRLAPDRTGTRVPHREPQQRIVEDNLAWVVNKLFGRRHSNLFPDDLPFTAHVTFDHDQ